MGFGAETEETAVSDLPCLIRRPVVLRTVTPPVCRAGEPADGQVADTVSFAVGIPTG